jgi:hypothetical protein
VVYGDWNNPDSGSFLRLYSDKEEQEKSSEMTERLAVFFGIPGIILFAIAQFTQIEWIVWVSMGFIVTALAIWCFDQI